MSIWGEHHIFEVYPKTGTQQKNPAGGREMQRNRIAVSRSECLRQRRPWGESGYFGSCTGWVGENPH